MDIQQKRIKLVLERMITLVEGEDYYAESFSPHLDDMLQDIHDGDGFGTEGQCDPRGDFRDGNWCCELVQGIDK